MNQALKEAMRQRKELEKKTGLKWVSHEEVMAKANKNKKLMSYYNAEIQRLDVASEMKKLRKNKRLTQSDVAKKIDMPQSMIARLENGSRGMNFDSIGRVASVYGKRLQLV